MINTVYELITDVMAKQYPDRVAFRYVAADGKTVVEKTYAQYVQDIRRAVTYFKENIPDIKGKRVGIMSRNCYEYGVNSFGAILAGAVVVTINQKKTWPELEYELGLAEPSLIVNDGIDYGCRPNIEAAYGDKLRPMDAFKDSAPAELVDCVGHDDLMVLMFTSGTTGRSKAVMLSERNFFTTVECQVKFGDAMLDYKHEHMPEDKNDVLSNFAILPLFHLGTFICLFVWACKGWALNLSADIRDFYRDLGLMHSDAIAVAPMLMEAIYKDVKRGRRARLNGVWNPCGSSAMFDGAMLAELAQQGMMITQVYGMTETCGDGIINYEQDESTSAPWASPTTTPSTSWTRRAKFASAAAASCWAITRTPRPPQKSSTPTAGSTPETWPVWTRTASITSPDARRISSSSTTVRTSAPKNWKICCPSARPSRNASSGRRARRSVPLFTAARPTSRPSATSSPRPTAPCRSTSG